MDKTQIIIISAAMAFLAVRLYQKYIKKDTGKSNHDKKQASDTRFQSESKDEEYEPYSKK